jgi:Domain of unknown function (DUF1929)/Bacterial Ig-like domain (group 1)/Carboxypeptidase regulatory-like domain
MTRLRRLHVLTLGGLLALSSLHCGENTDPPVASRIEMAGGNSQSGLVGEALANPLAVRVLDDNGDPVSGVAVTWDPNGAGSVSATSVTTGSDGRASVSRTLGPEPGEQTTTATVTGLEGSPVLFTSIASDGETPVLAMVTQPSSAAQSGVAFAVQPVVQLLDPEGNPLPEAGVEVTAAVTASTGTLGGTASVETDANGRATFTDLSLTGPAGSYTLRFSADGAVPVLSTPVTLGGSGGASIALITNPPTSALTGEVFDPVVQPAVEVKDAAGAAAPGVEVTAVKASGGGTLEGTTTATTDASGIARFGDLGISGTGSHTLRFTAGASSVTSSPVTVSPLSPQATTGSWGPLVNWDIVPLHMSLLPTGKILVWGKTDVGTDTLGLPRIWDPAAGGAPTGLPPIAGVDTMLFCAGHTLMPDGTLMSAGGHTLDDAGIAVTRFFDGNGVASKGPNMAFGRWYPTLTILADGRVLTMAGRRENGAVVRIPEIWEGGQWVQLPGASTIEIPYYPRNFVAPDGRIFYAGERISSLWFEVDASSAGGRGRWTDGPNHVWPFNREYGTAVMYEPGKILYTGGGGHSTWAQSPDVKSSQPTARSEIIDLNQSNPQWQETAQMSAPRRHLNSTILPDGQVLITGGTRGAGFVNIDPGLAVREAEVWNPATGQWTTLAANSRMRIYHSVSLLLPNGTVLHGASGDAMAGTVPVPAERNHEIFSPPYLFKGARPTITTAPATVSYGQAFAVATPNAAQVTSVRWIRLGSVTHAFDMSQRANTLQFTSTPTGVQVTAPSGPNLAPPGHYLLFILNRNGVPSEGKIVRVQ